MAGMRSPCMLIVRMWPTVAGMTTPEVAAARVEHVHVALEFSGNNADEGHAVAVLRVHVRLDLEDEGGEFLGRRIDGQAVAFTRQRRGREFEETV